MTNRPPEPLEVVQADGMYRDPAAGPGVAKRMLGEAEEFRATAIDAEHNGRPVAAASNLHEACRLALTAIAAGRGYSFRSEGTHKLVLDYGLGTAAVTKAEWDDLEALRVLRNRNNYAADAIELNPVVFTRIAAVVQRLTTPPSLSPKKTIPPPPPPALGR